MLFIELPAVSGLEPPLGFNSRFPQLDIKWVVVKIGSFFWYPQNWVPSYHRDPKKGP